jgi:hypothetical protein
MQVLSAGPGGGAPPIDDDDDDEEEEQRREQEQEQARRVLLRKLAATATDSVEAEAARRIEQQAMVAQLRRHGLLQAQNLGGRRGKAMLSQQSDAGDLTRDIRLEMLGAECPQAHEKLGQVLE